MIYHRLLRQARQEGFSPIGWEKALQGANSAYTGSRRHPSVYRLLTYFVDTHPGLPAEVWPVFYRTFLKAYQGKEVRVVLDQEPDVYYHGRAEVSGFSRNGRLGTFTLTVDADAYKYEINVSSEDWLWDVLNFETGIIRDYRGISVSGSSSKLLEGSGIPVVPAFLVSNLDESVSNYITFNGTRYTLQEGRNRFADLIIPAGGGRLYFYGKYTVNIEFRGGSL